MAEYQATESRGLEAVLEELEELDEYMPVLQRRLAPHCSKFRPGAKALDIGAAQGCWLTALQRLGYQGTGVEPWEPAIEVSHQLAEHTGIDTHIVQGWGEELPFEDESFDVVFGSSVLEHVDDPMAVFRETYRVLRPGGGFYFYTDSALSYNQAEIKGFPLFAFYPTALQRKIMYWTVEHRPAWVGYTTRPAIHWFTPWGLKRDLGTVGFSKVVERWDLKADGEMSGWKRRALRTVRSSKALRLAGEFVVPGSGFLAIK